MSEAREWGDSRHERLSDEDQTDRSARESTGRIEIRRPGRGKKSGHRGASNPQIVLIDGDSANPHPVRQAEGSRSGERRATLQRLTACLLAGAASWISLAH